MAISDQVTVTTVSAVTTLDGPVGSWDWVEVVNLDGMSIVTARLEGVAAGDGTAGQVYLPASAGASVLLRIVADADADGNVDISLDANSATCEVAVALLRDSDLP